MNTLVRVVVWVNIPIPLPRYHWPNNRTHRRPAGMPLPPSSHSSSKSIRRAKKQKKSKMKKMKFNVFDQLLV